MDRIALLLLMSALLLVEMPGGLSGAPVPPASGPTAHSAGMPMTGPSLVGVSGTLRGILPDGALGPYLNGSLVTVYARPCTGKNLCPVVSQVPSTSPRGSWTVFLSPGDYIIATNRTGAFGGAEYPFTLGTSSPSPIGLLASPWQPYDNATFVLPGWNNLSAYAANCNLALPCLRGNPSLPYGSQVPLLSWTQDGVYYVNASFELVYYSFANQTLVPIAPWLALYENMMQYDGIENTEFITVDGTYIYELGCAALCVQNSSLIFYAVNVSTGRTFRWNLTGINDTSLLKNVQVDMIGEHGNHSIASVVDENGRVFGYNLWNRTQWLLGNVPFFEANNNYWIPALDSYIDVEAGGSSGDGMYQFQLAGPAPGTSLSNVASRSFSSGYITHAVNGMVFNVTARTLTFTVQGIRGTAQTLTVPLNGSGIIQNVSRRWGSSVSTFGQWPNTSAYPNVESSEHRPSLLTTGTAFSGYWNGWFDNRSAFVDPITGVFYDTNISFDHTESSLPTFQQNQLSPAALEGLFYNTSYALIPWSYDCRTNLSSCPILGDGTPGSNGTVWWTWRDGLPEFPFQGGEVFGEPAPPSDPDSLNLSTTAHTLTARWTPHLGGGAALLNYSILYGTDPAHLNASVSVGPGARQVVLGALTSSTRYFVQVQAWNLHWHSPGITGNITTSTLFGTLNLTITPASANVTVQGRALPVLGGTVRVLLPIGGYWVNVTDGGYYPFHRWVNITLNNVSSLVVRLGGIAPILQGSLHPAWATLYLDQTIIPVAPNGSFRLSVTPGTHLLSAAASSYIPLGPINVTLRYGGQVNETLTLVHDFGWINGSVYPADAFVTLDGAPVPTENGTFNLTLTVGSYWLDAFAPGFRPEARGPILVSPFQRTLVILGLVPYPGLWEVQVTPSNASLSVDNTSYPLTDGHASLSLSPGPHNLESDLAGYEPFHYSWSVLPNQTLSLWVVLNRSLGRIDLRLSPAHAALSIDGTPVPAAGDGTFDLTLPVGTHQAIASAPGFLTRLWRVEITDHQWVNDTVALLPEPSPAMHPAIPAPWVWSGALATGAIAAVTLLYWKRGRAARRRRT